MNEQLSGELLRRAGIKPGKPSVTAEGAKKFSSNERQNLIDELRKNNLPVKQDSRVAKNNEKITQDNEERKKDIAMNTPRSWDKSAESIDLTIPSPGETLSESVNAERSFFGEDLNASEHFSESERNFLKEDDVSNLERKAKEAGVEIEKNGGSKITKALTSFSNGFNTMMDKFFLTTFQAADAFSATGKTIARAGESVVKEGIGLGADITHNVIGSKKFDKIAQWFGFGKNEGTREKTDEELMAESRETNPIPYDREETGNILEVIQENFGDTLEKIKKGMKEYTKGSLSFTKDIISTIGLGGIIEEAANDFIDGLQENRAKTLTKTEAGSYEGEAMMDKSLTLMERLGIALARGGGRLEKAKEQYVRSIENLTQNARNEQLDAVANDILETLRNNHLLPEKNKMGLLNTLKDIQDARNVSLNVHSSIENVTNAMSIDRDAQKEAFLTTLAEKITHAIKNVRFLNKETKEDIQAILAFPNEISLQQIEEIINDSINTLIEQQASHSDPLQMDLKKIKGLLEESLDTLARTYEINFDKEVNNITKLIVKTGVKINRIPQPTDPFDAEPLNLSGAWVRKTKK